MINIAHLSPIREVLTNRHAAAATLIVTPRHVIRAAKRHFKVRGRRHHEEVVVTVGRPNWDTRRHIAVLKRAGEPFPVKRVWVQYHVRPTRRSR